MGSAIGRRERVGREARRKSGSCDPPAAMMNEESARAVQSDHCGGGDDLPDVNSEDSSSAAAKRLRLLMKQLDSGVVPSIAELRKTVSYAADVLSHSRVLPVSTEADLETLTNEQVRDWLASTFTRRDSIYGKRDGARLSFRTVARAMAIGQYIGHIHTQRDNVQVRPLSPSPELSSLLESRELNSWSFDMFHLDSLSGHQPLRALGMELFNRHNLLNEHKIPQTALDGFLMQIEAGYKHHNNTYHNSIHGADVLHTVHYLIERTGLKPWLTSLEVLSMLLAAAIHDVDHPGTTNTFQVQSCSELALLYNDRSVLENHHLCYAFRILKDDDFNILKGLTEDDYRTVRELVIDLVLATDMTGHFDKLKEMKLLLSAPDCLAQLEGDSRSGAFCLLIHMADISHPGKRWSLHSQWVDRLMKEFFSQGDKEKELGIECSPLCDREKAPIPESQVGFINNIVGPAYELIGNMLEAIVRSEDAAMVTSLRVWEEPLLENKRKWEWHSQRRAAEPIAEEPPGD